MIENVIIDHLTELMDVKVSAEREETPPAEYVLIERTGGGGNLIREATIAAQAYADRKYRAAEIIEQAVKAMLSLTELNAISKCDLNAGPYNFTDTQEKKYRFQAVFDLVYYPEMTEE